MDSKFGETVSDMNKQILNSLELMTENDYYSLESDKGKVLSMDQPWASLVVEGIKRFEGRSWDLEYRGIYGYMLMGKT